MDSKSFTQKIHKTYKVNCLFIVEGYKIVQLSTNFKFFEPKMSCYPHFYATHLYLGEHGERSREHFLWYLQGLIIAGGYKTIKPQNLLFLIEATVFVLVFMRVCMYEGRVEVKF